MFQRPLQIALVCLATQSLVAALAMPQRMTLSLEVPFENEMQPIAMQALVPLPALTPALDATQEVDPFVVDVKKKASNKGQ